MICKRCKADKARSEFGSYQQRADYYCITCREAVSKARAATLEAQARGYASAGNTPEYKREQRRRAAEAAGRVFVTADERKARAERRAEEGRVEVEQRKAERAKLQAMRRANIGAEIQKRNAAFRERYWQRPEYERQRTANYKARHWDRKLAWDEKRDARIGAQSDGSATCGAIAAMKARATHCPYCGERMADSEKQTDHIVPLCAGGQHSLSNIVIACATCNGRKGAMLPARWDERRQVIQKS